MSYQTTFQRYELKYLLTGQEKEAILFAMQPFMRLDDYGRTTIRNLYLDTDNFRLIRRSLEKPVYKEKLRIRTYRRIKPSDMAYVELKKKYKSVVYKRRMALPEYQVMKSFREGSALPVHSQIEEEIEYFRDYYGILRPTVFLSYEREAYYALDGSDFRVTLDENILYREDNLSLTEEAYGSPLLGEGQTLREIKTSGGIPLWMSHVLSSRQIYKTSFSKYGAAYRNMVKYRGQGEVRYA